MKKSGKISDKEWQQVPTNGNRWQRITTIVVSAKLPFFGIKGKPITKHSKEDPIIQRSCEVPWKGPTELRADLAKKALTKKNQQQESAIETGHMYFL